MPGPEDELEPPGGSMPTALRWAESCDYPVATESLQGHWEGGWMPPAIDIGAWEELSRAYARWPA
jgi:hypothetical protein